MDTNQPDWNISELYSRAWEVIKKNKILWILGAATASGGSYNFRSSNFNSSDFQKIFQSNPNSPTSPEKISQVLGASTDKPFNDAIFNIFTSVHAGLYVLLGTELLLVIIFGLAIGLVYRAFVQGMLTQAAFTALTDKKVTLADTGSKVLLKIRPLIWIFVVPFLTFFLITFTIFLILLLGITFTFSLFKILFILALIIAAGGLIYWAVMLNLSLIWAPREILFNQKNGQQSLISGFKIAKKKFWPSLLLGIANNILAFVIFLLPLLLIGGLIVAGVVIGIKNHSSIPALIVSGIIIGIPIIIGFNLLSGIIVGFKDVVWTNAYTKIKGKYEN